jgi:S-DNA-T family DNA segregation ATPase FtsK/SpoIIIE
VQSLSPETKKDIVGGLLAILGVVSVLGFFSEDQGIFLGWFSHVMKLIGGWGGIFIPLALLAIGLWLLFRNVEKFPRLSAGRTTGILLIYVNLVSWFHFVIMGSQTTASLGQGGGYLGYFFDRALENTLGRAGAGVFLVAWAIIALIFIIDLPLPEIARRIEKGFSRSEKSAAVPAASQPRLQTKHPQKVLSYEERTELPDGFNPINLHGEAEKPQIVVTPRQRVRESAATPAASKPAAQPSIPEKINDNAPAATTVRPQKAWVLPSVEAILDPATPVTIQTHLDKDRARTIEETLASFSAPSHVVEIHRGPTVTQFGVEPDFIETRNGRMRVRVAKIVSLSDDLALALAAPSIRIQAPVPGRSYVGIEVPNTEIAVVGLREVIESEAYRKVKSSLKLALGKDVAGKPICADLTSMPHLLIAGTTNSGKSVCVNSILSSLLLTNSPSELRLVLVDPKRVELTGYNHIPHLLAPVVVDPERVIGALQWVIREMDARYHKFNAAGVRNISEFNRRSPDEHLPYLVVVIDELADLMMMAPDETERCITRLAQLARATGIHLIIATQRPSVDVVTGLIKANLPARIAFMVASGVDSRVILDQPGAEKLLGRGDMLYQAPDAPAPVRLQGTYVSDGEIQRLTESWKAIAYNNPDAESNDPFNKASFEMLSDNVPLKQGALWDDGSVSNEDPMLKDATSVVRREGKASISMLQRRLRVGYTRAARLIDTLEERGIIGPQQTGSQVREILDYGEEPQIESEDSQES